MPRPTVWATRPRPMAPRKISIGLRGSSSDHFGPIHSGETGEPVTSGQASKADDKQVVAAEVRVKVEPEETGHATTASTTALDLEIDAFLSSPITKLNEVQKASNEGKHIFGAVQADKWAASFAEDVLNCVKRHDKTIGIISKIVLGSVPQRTAIPKLLRLVDKQLHEHRELREAAILRFGVVMDKPEKRRRKAKEIVE